MGEGVVFGGDDEPTAGACGEDAGDAADDPHGGDAAASTVAWTDDEIRELFESVDDMDLGPSTDATDWTSMFDKGVFTCTSKGLEFVALMKTHDGTRKRMPENVRTTLEGLLPRRRGCRLERHWPASGEQRWQIWYPLSAGEKRPASNTATGPSSLHEVLKWAKEKHEIYIMS